METNIRIGVSGWRYPPWRGQFYPDGLIQDRELSFAAGKFPTIEINGSFYSLQRPSSYAAWHQATPDGFMFAVKAPRFITHMKRLRDIDKPLANFFASGVFNLKEKLGPILWQLPPTMKFDIDLLGDFLRKLPRDTGAALTMARRRDERMIGRSSLKIDVVRPLRHALEVRHSTFISPSFIELLRQHCVALVIADTGRRWPELHDVTANFLYLRLHGRTELYRSRYSDASLRRWAERLRVWANGSQPGDLRMVLPGAGVERVERDVFCYFDNTDKLHAPFNAQRLMTLLGIEWGPEMRTVARIAAHASRRVASRSNAAGKEEARLAAAPRR